MMPQCNCLWVEQLFSMGVICGAGLSERCRGHNLPRVEKLGLSSQEVSCDRIVGKQMTLFVVFYRHSVTHGADYQAHAMGKVHHVMMTCYLYASLAVWHVCPCEACL